MFMPAAIVILALFANQDHAVSQPDYGKYFNLHQPAMIDQGYHKHVSERRQQDLHCLASNMYFEARGESLMGRLAVGFVTINRVRSSRFPDRICDVIQQAHLDKNGKPIRSRCQFSWYCDGTTPVVTDSKTYDQILKEAQYLYKLYYEVPVLLDITEGSTHFHAEYVSPHWNRVYTRTTTVGAHIFYSNGG
jgi:spore germination cell wall hydrolase CwlJ-like protein